MTEIKRTKNLYKVLQRDEEITFYASEKINNNLIKKAKKSSYPKDKVFFELFKEVKDVNFEENDKPIIPTYLPFMEKKKILIDQLCIVLFRPLVSYMLNCRFAFSSKIGS